MIDTVRETERGGTGNTVKETETEMAVITGTVVTVTTRRTTEIATEVPVVGRKVPPPPLLPPLVTTPTLAAAVGVEDDTNMIEIGKGTETMIAEIETGTVIVEDGVLIVIDITLPLDISSIPKASTWREGGVAVTVRAGRREEGTAAIVVGGVEDVGTEEGTGDIHSQEVCGGTCTINLSTYMYNGRQFLYKYLTSSTCAN